VLHYDFRPNVLLCRDPSDDPDTPESAASFEVTGKVHSHAEPDVAELQQFLPCHSSPHVMMELMSPET
jgi:hypothetical protein